MAAVAAYELRPAHGLASKHNAGVRDAVIPMRAVFVHGAGGGGWEWTVWQRVFCAHGAQARAPDLQPSTRGLAATRLADYSSQVLQWCAGGGPLLLVGASLGGLLALLVAPQVAPAGIVLVNPIAPAGIEPRPAARDYPDIVPWGRARSLQSTQRALPDADDAARLFAFRRWRDESGTVLRAAAAGIAVEPPRCPVLVLASEYDEAVAPAASRALAERLGADFRLIGGASHVGPLLGRGAANIAEEAWRWCADRFARAR
jgi:pimeloyl-ACP methyl ester carboxylesterase